MTNPPETSQPIQPLRRSLLYENQKTWHDAFDARPIFEDYATRIGLNLEKFRSDSAGETVAQRIFLDGKRAHALGVSGTPTVYMNGREVPFESLAPDKLRALINAQLTAKWSPGSEVSTPSR